MYRPCELTFDHLLSEAMASGGILRDTPSPSSTREPSSVRVIDAATLKQEEANDEIFREIDEYPTTLVVPESADVSQELPAGSSTQSREGTISQSADEQGEDYVDLTSYVANLLTVRFTGSQLWDFKEYFSIPDDVGIRVPIEGESIMEPILNKDDIERAFCPSYCLGIRSEGGGPTKVELVAMKGKRLPHFSIQLVVHKPLIPGTDPILVFPPKRSSTSYVSTPASKRAKLEALAAITAPSSSPNTDQT
ncbi:hypothetical protein LIER_03462 [Lithospermum erythrorhizon]|uniref:Uncharacterized protein n=1 Tax=Lithospermum erythrorhizon TaxID=34254 RepID=A0AAV3NUJ3_LITER